MVTSYNEGQPFIVEQREFMFGMRATVALHDDGYMVEAVREDVARWIGYRVSYDEGKVIWWGTRKTTGGTFAAQFQIVDEEVSPV